MYTIDISNQGYLHLKEYLFLSTSNVLKCNGWTLCSLLYCRYLHYVSSFHRQITALTSPSSWSQALIISDGNRIISTYAVILRRLRCYDYDMSSRHSIPSVYRKFTVKGNKVMEFIAHHSFCTSWGS